jgi:hypothetical protein
MRRISECGLKDSLARINADLRGWSKNLDTCLYALVRAIRVIRVDRCSRIYAAAFF